MNTNFNLSQKLDAVHARTARSGTARRFAPGRPAAASESNDHCVNSGRTGGGPQ